MTVQSVQLDRLDARMVELLKQTQYRPMSVEQQVMVIYAATKGYIDDIPLDRIAEFQEKFLAHVDASAADLRKELADKKELTDAVEQKLIAAIKGFKERMWTK